MTTTAEVASMAASGEAGLDVGMGVDVVPVEDATGDGGSDARLLAKQVELKSARLQGKMRALQERWGLI